MAAPISRLSHLKLVVDVTNDVCKWNYPGGGMIEDSYVVDRISDNLKNGFNLSQDMKCVHVIIFPAVGLLARLDRLR